MPIKRLTPNEADDIWNILEEVREGAVDVEEAVSDLNHYFAYVYGYQKPKRKSRSKFNYSKAIYTGKVRKKRKLSGWQKFIKANSKKPRFKLRSGKLNLKKMGVAYRKTSAYKRSKK